MQPNSCPGLFIAVEGIDGAGKETQAINISLWLKRLGFSVHKTQEPWSDPASKTYAALDRIVYCKTEIVSPEKIQDLFIANRKEHLKEEIIPNLASGIAEVTERYAFSTVAYGAATTNLPIKYFLNKHSNCFFPDLTFIIDLPAEVSISRLPQTKHLFEKQEILSRVRTNYLELCRMFSDSGVRIINGDQSPQAVFSDMIPYLEFILALKGGIYKV